jgi:hypothetical protein
VVAHRRDGNERERTTERKRRGERERMDSRSDATRNEDDSQRDDALRNVRGAVYLPQKDWNVYQMWANYRDSVVERDLGYAATLGLNSVRAFASYEYWQEDGPAFFTRIEHFLSACEARGIRPIVVLFEAPPKAPPTEENLHATDPENAFGVHSPSRPEVLRPRNWQGYPRSPIHFARRWAQEYGEGDRLLATEIMNEPGKVQPRRDFVLDALREVRAAAPDATLTMGTKDVRFARYYDDPDALDGLRGLDAYQFHMNLPRNPAAARRYMADQRTLADEITDETGEDGDGDGANTRKPLWCTEWQRTLEEPPSRFAPNLASLAPTIRGARTSGALDGDFFWSLMLSPAYLRIPRRRGRVNGLFHRDGAVYSRADAEAIAGRELDLEGRRALPASWDAHSFPYPGRVADEAALTDESAGDSTAGNSKSEGVSDLPEFRNLRESLVERLEQILGAEPKSE